MKKNVLILVVWGLALLTGCTKKSSSTLTDGGSWTFRSRTYNVNAATGLTNSLSATNAFNSNVANYGVLYCTFLNSLPTSNGTFTVAEEGQPLTANQISLRMTIDSTTSPTYYSTGGNGTQTVSVTVSNGMVSISGSGIEMSDGIDSSTLSLNIHQLN